jgi:hypothetical protein
MVAAKLAFIHRTLWQRDQAYRWAVLLGPPPLLGCALAALALAAIHHVLPMQQAPSANIPWARWNPPVPRDGQPFTEPPAAPIPPTDAKGGYAGYRPGWLGFIHPMTIDAAMDTNVIAVPQAKFDIDQTTISLGRILDAGPPAGLFVGEARTFVVIRTAGLYAFSVQLERSSPETANCLVRLGSHTHRLLRNVNINMNGQVVLKYPATEFQLQPGLFFVGLVVGCWRGDHMVGPGDVTLMIRRPGESSLQPAKADELIWPVAPAN